jgi:DNA-directed RNA polymerase specialized sigma24 family protein
MPMSVAGSVSHWILQLKAGDRAAAQPLWETYCQQLLERARRKLAGMPCRAADEEDVALSAFDSFYRAAERGRFPQLNDRHDLWQLLVVLTERKAIDLIHHERRARRGGGRVLDEGALPRAGSAVEEAALAQVGGREPTPAFAAQVAEECEHLLDILGDPELKAVALWKMEGYTIDEIAAKLGCVGRTVDRKLRLIRSTWEKEIAQE